MLELHNQECVFVLDKGVLNLVVGLNIQVEIPI